ncbi:hypothetical protein HJD18_06070 [Thermoleophilia bacterium SCSIO 60948]|nr:hypothetical protein HJD18_06070 [Thermoleophilia bacterium SCSIO 60948]
MVEDGTAHARATATFVVVDVGAVAAAEAARALRRTAAAAEASLTAREAAGGTPASSAEAASPSGDLGVVGVGRDVAARARGSSAAADTTAATAPCLGAVVETADPAESEIAARQIAEVGMAPAAAAVAAVAEGLVDALSSAPGEARSRASPRLACAVLRRAEPPPPPLTTSSLVRSPVLVPE